jgi:hypothetical protein
MLAFLKPFRPFAARRLAFGVLALALLGACSNGGECDECGGDADCTGGLVCVSFNDGSRRCGSGVGATTCRKP